MDERDGEFAASTRTTDKYCLRVRDPASAGSPFEVKVSNDPKKILTTVVYVRGVFQRGASDRVSIKAVGQAIPKAVRIAEIVKHSVLGLHQLNSIASMEVEDVYVPLEQGLDEVVVRKKIAVLEIVLLREPGEAARAAAGYQPPLDRSLVRPARGGRFYRPRVGGREPDAAFNPLRIVRVRPRGGPGFGEHYEARGPPRAFRGRAGPPREPFASLDYGFEPRGAWRGFAPPHFASSADRGTPAGVFRVRGGRVALPHYRPRVAPVDRYESYY